MASTVLWLETLRLVSLRHLGQWCFIHLCRLLIVAPRCRWHALIIGHFPHLGWRLKLEELISTSTCQSTSPETRYCGLPFPMSTTNHSRVKIRVYFALTLVLRGTGMIASSSTFCPHLYWNTGQWTGWSPRHARNPLSGERRKTLLITHHALSPPPSHHHLYIIHLINWLQRFYRITMSLKRPFVLKSDVKQWFTTTTTTLIGLISSKPC